MPAPLSIRTDRGAGELRRLARRERDGRVGACLLALANALDGLPREEAARLAGMAGQTLGDWMHRYNAEEVEGLRDRPRPGPACSTRAGRPRSRRWSSEARACGATAASPGAPATRAPWSRCSSGSATARPAS